MRKDASRSGLSRKERDQRFAIKEWANKLVNVPAFVLGCSPSILETNLLPLEDYFTIGINRIFKIFDPTILMWQDKTFWDTEKDNLNNLKAIKVARDIADPQRRFYNFYIQGDNDYQFSNQTHILNGIGSSGPLAVQLANAMGCSPIIIIGLDCFTNNHTDFYGTNQFWTKNTIRLCQEGLDAVKRNCPKKIINCGKSNLWPQEKLETVLQNIDSIHKKGREYYKNRIIATSST